MGFACLQIDTGWMTQVGNTRGNEEQVRISFFSFQLTMVSVYTDIAQCDFQPMNTMCKDQIWTISTSIISHICHYFVLETFKFFF